MSKNVENRLTIKAKLRSFKVIYWNHIPKIIDSITALRVLNKIYARSIAKDWVFIDTTVDILAASEPYTEPTEIKINTHPWLHKDTFKMNAGTCYNYLKFLMDANLILRVDVRGVVRDTMKYNALKRYALNIPAIIRHTSITYQQQTTKSNVALIQELSELESFFVELFKKNTVGLPIEPNIILNDMHLTKANRKKRVMPKRKKPATVLTLVNKAEESM